MSLEDALNRHSTALDNLAAAIREQKPVAATQAGSLETNGAAEQAAPTTPRRGRPPGAAGARAPLNDATSAGQPAIKYDPDVREGVLKVAEQKGHNTAIALLARFGVRSGKELKPEQYPAVMAAVAQELAASVASVA